MIPLGNIPLAHQDSIAPMRKKILQAVKLLTGDAVLAARIASISSQMGRSLYQSSREAKLNLGLFRGVGGVAFSIIFMVRESYFKVELLRSFFDEVTVLEPENNWYRLQAILWIGDSHLPPDSLIQKLRNTIEEKSRSELMLELEENNQKLLQSLNNLKETTLLKERMSSLNAELQQENLRMGAQIDLVKEMQQLILPKPEELAKIKDLDIAGFMQPADDVGGDYYDVFYNDGIVTIAIGDVTGHGLESGILMVMTQTAVRTLQTMKEKDPVCFLDTLNRAIYDNIERMESEKNLTLAVLNYCDRKVSISGQHEETIVFRKGGKIERIDTMNLGFPIGLYDDIAEFIDHHFIELERGDGIVLYTDGITEAKDIQKKQYGIEKLCETISSNWERSAEEIKQAVIKSVYEHIGEQKVFDDITLLVLKQN
jgi:sigma-B regulation protein RsbU (phosphoserine phosphatase)